MGYNIGAIMNLFNHLMKLSLYDNYGDLQPHVTTYQGEVHLHQLQYPLHQNLTSMTMANMTSDHF
jgi:hypothetical protein